MPRSRITVAGVTHEVVADRGGVIDTVLAGRLEPGLADADHVGRGRRAGRDARLRGRTRCAIRRRVRHRRHRDGDGAPPAPAGRVELVRRRRARASAGARHGRAHGAPRARPAGRAGDLPLDRCVEHRADAHPIPPAAPLPARGDAAHRLGSDPRPVVPQRQGAQALEPAPCRRASSRRSSGC